MIAGNIKQEPTPALMNALSEVDSFISANLYSSSGRRWYVLLRSLEGREYPCALGSTIRNFDSQNIQLFFDLVLAMRASPVRDQPMWDVIQRHRDFFEPDEEG